MNHALDVARGQRDAALLELDYQRAESKRLSTELFKLLDIVGMNIDEVQEAYSSGCESGRDYMQERLDSAETQLAYVEAERDRLLGFLFSLYQVRDV